MLIHWTMCDKWNERLWTFRGVAGLTRNLLQMNFANLKEPLSKDLQIFCLFAKHMHLQCRFYIEKCIFAVPVEYLISVYSFPSNILLIKVSLNDNNQWCDNYFVIYRHIQLSYNSTTWHPWNTFVIDQWNLFIKMKTSPS